MKRKIREAKREYGNRMAVNIKRNPKLFYQNVIT